MKRVDRWMGSCYSRKTMPIKTMALKQLRKSRKRAQRNKAFQSELKTLKKTVLTLIAQQKLPEARQLMPTLMRRFAQAGAKNLIHRNTASRVISRLSKRLTKQANTSSPPPAPAPS